MDEIIQQVVATVVAVFTYFVGRWTKKLPKD